MTHAARRPLAMLVAAGVVASMAAPGTARATMIGTAFINGGPGTITVGGTLYARAGASLTLFVITGGARCVEVTGALEARRVSAVDATNWAFPFTAGSGNGPQDVTVTAWSEAWGTGCAGTPGAAGTARFALDNAGPQVTPVVSPAAIGAGWHQGEVSITWSASDAGVGVQTGPAPVVATQVDETAGTVHEATATDRLGNVGTGSVLVRVDRTAPTVVAAQEPAPNAAGWNAGDVAVTFACSDGLSGVETCPAPVTLANSTAGQEVTGRAVDGAGNVSAYAALTVRIDREPPAVALVGGPQDGATYDAASLPAAPACTAHDGLSGVDGDCAVAGYDASPGTHTITATARDRAGNVGETSLRYSVTSWRLLGFRQPVAMDALNVVKGGSTVPLKFEVFDGTTELMAADVVTDFGVRPVSCAGTPTSDEEIAGVTTGGTALRYDAGGGQFVQNWQTPRTPDTCYEVTITTRDGSSLSALFKTR